MSKAKKAPALPTENEGEFRAKILQWARLCGWRFVGFRPARTNKGWRTAFEGDGGFPDLVLVRRGVLIIAELKSETGKYRPGQEDWLAALRAAHQHVYTWRPSMFDEIKRLLREGPQ